MHTRRRSTKVKTASEQNKLYSRTIKWTGKTVRRDPLSWRLYAGRTEPKIRPLWGESAGTLCKSVMLKKVLLHFQPPLRTFNLSFEHTCYLTYTCSYVACVNLTTPIIISMAEKSDYNSKIKMHVWVPGRPRTYPWNTPWKVLILRGVILVSSGLPHRRAVPRTMRRMFAALHSPVSSHLRRAPLG